MKAYDFLRTIGWSIIDFIYGLIDNLFEILREINAYNLIDSISNNSVFKNFHSGIIIIALTLLGLFAIWKFVVKIIEPDAGLNTSGIVKEIIKCTALVVLSVLLFSQVSIFSIKLSGFTASMFDNKNVTLAKTMEVMYVDYAKGYEESDEFFKENYKKNIEDNTFTEAKQYNEKYVTSGRWILPNKKAYKYDINWIMSIIVGAFFLYSLFFSGMMLARRQIEFIFLFLISPIVFATSVGSKQRRSAVFEQLTSLTVQAAVVMLIIGITVMIMQAINGTTFFADSKVKELVLKSLMYLGCATFLLTGSQTVNRFIGQNVSANSGREQLMSLMAFKNMAGGVASKVASGIGGGALLGAGMSGGVLSKLGANKLMNKVGNAISGFGLGMADKSNSWVKRKTGNFIAGFGSKLGNDSFSKVSKAMRKKGLHGIGNTFKRNYYRRF